MSKEIVQQKRLPLCTIISLRLLFLEKWIDTANEAVSKVPAYLAILGKNGSTSCLFLQKVSSVSRILLIISFELTMIEYHIWGRVVGNVLANISLWNIYYTLLLEAIFRQSCQAAFCCCGHYWVNDQNRDLRCWHVTRWYWHHSVVTRAMSGHEVRLEVTWGCDTVINRRLQPRAPSSQMGPEGRRGWANDCWWLSFKG